MPKTMQIRQKYFFLNFLYYLFCNYFLDFSKKKTLKKDEKLGYDKWHKAVSPSHLRFNRSRGEENQSQTYVDSQTQTFIDSNSHYYFHPSNYLGTMIFTCVLNEDNYPTWRRVMENALHAKNKIYFIDRTLAKQNHYSLYFFIWKKNAI